MINLSSNFYSTRCSELGNLGVFFVIAIMIALFLVTLSLGFASYAQDAEKLSVFESGFMPYASARQKFPIQFYLVAILFILFDLEIICLLPLAAIYSNLLMSSLVCAINVFFIVCCFLTILVIGLIYELANNCLD